MPTKPLKSKQKPTRTGATVSIHGRGPYRVGYARPPEAYQFKPGQSGNPLGRPTAAARLRRLGLAPILADALAEQVLVYVGGKKRRMTRLTAMTKTFAKAAAEGDARLIALLVEQFRVVMVALLERLPA
jgi:hypothetical protein